MRSKHGDDIVGDDRIRNNEIIEFADTQVIPSGSTCKILGTLNFFNFNSNNDEKIV